MIKKQKLLTLVIFILSSLFLTLCTNPTEPKETLLPEKEYEPGTRDYVWSIDTLNNDAPFNYYTKIWGSSPNDIWIVGGGPKENMQILKFNGDSVYSIYDIDITSTPWSVFGFDSNDVWIGGSNFDIKHYDGESLTTYSRLPLEGFRSSGISDIWGINKSDVFAVGGLSNNDGSLYASIMHYNGIDWQYSVDPIFNLQFLQIFKDNFHDDYYLLAHRVSAQNPDSAYIIKFDGNSIHEENIASSINPLAKQLALMDGTLYFMIDEELYKLWNGKIAKKLSLNGTSVSGIKIFGRNENDFFIQCDRGIGHYDGINLRVLYNITERFGIVDGIIFDNDVFFMGFFKDSFKFFLIHGKKTL